METTNQSIDLRKHAGGALVRVLFFILSYLILLGLAGGLVYLCGWAAILILGIRASFVTLMLAIGLFAAGLLVFYFLIKFIFKKHRTNLDGLHEITAEDEPELFKLIDEVAEQVGTQKPKHVYLNHEVNAFVFYDSSFWSMFLPIRKNLAIGVGLLYGTTQQEFKAILAHEFGHFSQKSMKVGSYVYQVNRIIINMLYDNQGYFNTLNWFSSISDYFYLFAKMALSVVNAVQNILRKLYELVNLKFYALSREMEFHADQVAAEVAGAQALISGLNRLDLVEEAIQKVNEFCQHNKVSPENAFEFQLLMLNDLGKTKKLPMVNQLPLIDWKHPMQQIKPKIAINSQWNTHPSVEDRSKRLSQGPQGPDENNTRSAYLLLKDSKHWAQLFTETLFPNNPEQTTSSLDTQTLWKKYEASEEESSNPLAFNKYFDKHPFPVIAPDSVENLPTTNKTLDELVGEEAIYRQQAYYSGFSDKDFIAWLANPESKHELKYFEYDGVRYSMDDVLFVKTEIDKKYEALEKEIQENDQNIVSYFYQKAKAKNLQQDFAHKIEQLNVRFNDFKDTHSLCDELQEKLQFINVETPFITIQANFTNLKSLENKLRQRILEYQNNPEKMAQIPPVNKALFEEYMQQEWIYFVNNEYQQEQLGYFTNAIDAYRFSTDYWWFIYRRDFFVWLLTL